MSHSWDYVRNQVRQIRAELQSMYPLQVLSIIKDFTIHNNVLYFLSNTRFDNDDASDVCPTRHLQVYQVDLEQLNDCQNNIDLSTNDDDNKQSSEDYLITISKTIPLLKKKLAFAGETMSQPPIFPTTSNSTEQQQQQQELNLQGVSTFQIHNKNILYTFQNNVYLGELGKIPKLIPNHEVPTHHVHLSTNIITTEHALRSPFHLTTTSTTQTSTVQNTSELFNTRNEPKLGGYHHPLVSFIRQQDIWVTDINGHDVQLTFCSEKKEQDPTLKCGIAEYMMQEEFHRFTGYFWSPNTSDRLNTERILYLETSEKDVDEVYISRASSMNKTQKGSSSVRYPRAGQPNAKSVVNIVEFEVEAATDCHPTGIVIKNIVHKSLSDALEKQFPWVEYIVRLGWFADGQSIWLQLLSRDQKKTVVIKVALSQFSEAAFTVNPTEAEILWEETSSTWINISDAFYFMQQSSNNNSTRFIWSSEKMNGYRHLFLVEKRRDDAIPKIKQLTTGEWCCVDKPLFVDEERSLVYFSAKKHTPLETHFYVIPYDSNHHREVEPVLLTRLGFSHQVTMISPDYFVDCFSTLHDPQVVTVQKIKHDEPTTTPVRIGCSALIMPVVLKKHCCCCNETPPPSPPSYDAHEYCQSNHAYRYHHRRRSSSIRFHTVHGPDPLEAEDAFCTMASSIYRYCRQGDGLEQKLDVDQQRTQQLNGEIFQFTTSDGELLYGCLYKPFCYKPGHSYPTLLHIYGGPQTQLVVNEFRFPRIMRYLMGVYFGFAVVIIDGRGSSDRGMKFESHIKNRLGKVELKDQLEGLQFLHDTMFGASMPPPSSSISPTLEDEQKTAKREKKPVIDLNRVAITGWSYGGYLSLIALAQYPDRFKIAVVGAPVTQWELYDAAYTERYMGLPSENKEAYQESNVLTYIERFPSQEHRLLLAHGLIDENVHFTNTELLVSQLVKHKKPHYLQVYPTEKHGIRHASVNEHFETLMFYWLVNYL